MPFATFIQVIDLRDEEESEYWTVMSVISEGKPVESVSSRPSLSYVAYLLPIQLKLASMARSKTSIMFTSGDMYCSSPEVIIVPGFASPEYS